MKTGKRKIITCQRSKKMICHEGTKTQSLELPLRVNAGWHAVLFRLLPTLLSIMQGFDFTLKKRFVIHSKQGNG